GRAARGRLRADVDASPAGGDLEVRRLRVELRLPELPGEEALELLRRLGRGEVPVQRLAGLMVLELHTAPALHRDRPHPHGACSSLTIRRVAHRSTDQ